MNLAFFNSVLGQDNIECKYLRDPEVECFLTGRKNPGQKRSLCFFLVVEGNILDCLK